MPVYPVREVGHNHRRSVYSRVHPRDLINFEVYCGFDKVGSVENVLVEDSGQFRYFVIRTGSWFLGRKVLLPVGRSRIDRQAGRIYIDRLTRSQLKWVPEYKGLPIDENYEEQVRDGYRSRKITTSRMTTRTTASTRTQFMHRPAQSHRLVRPYQLHEASSLALNSGSAPIPAVRSAGQFYTHYALGFFAQQREAEQAIAELNRAGFSQDQISLIAHRLDLQSTRTEATLLTSLDHRRFGFPQNQVQLLNHRIAQGDYLLIVQGSLVQLQQAKAVLTQPRIRDFGIYPTAQPTSSDYLYQQPADPMIALTVDAPPKRQPRIEQANPQVKIIDRREQTRQPRK